MKNFLEKIKPDKFFSILLLFICGINILYYACLYLSIFKEYLYILGFLSSKGLMLLIFYFFMKLLLELPFTKEFQKEYELFNKDPQDQPLIVLVRKYQFFIFMASYLSYTLGTTYLVEDPTLSYLLGVISFIFSVLHVVQFVVSTHRYIKISTKNVTHKKGFKSLVRSIASAVTVKKVAIVFLECVKTVIPLGLGAELAWKLSHEGMSDVSPLREARLNQIFSEDRTDRWTKTKAATACHNRSMGYPHDRVYSVEDIMEKLQNSPKK